MFDAAGDDPLFSFGMGAVASDPGFGMGAAVSAPSPTQGFSTAGDPRQKSYNMPAQVRVDAANLRILGYSAPDTGNAYDPKFQAAVRSFQAAAKLTADGLIGPTTRKVIAEMAAVAGAAPNAGGGGGGLLSTISTSDGAISPVAIGVGVVAVGALAWFFLR